MRPRAAGHDGHAGVRPAGGQAPPEAVEARASGAATAAAPETRREAAGAPRDGVTGAGGTGSAAGRRRGGLARLLGLLAPRLGGLLPLAALLLLRGLGPVDQLEDRHGRAVPPPG